LPLEPRRYLSDAKTSLSRAHKELVEHGFLATEPTWEWSRQRRRITYTPGTASPLEASQSTATRSDGGGEQVSLAKDLVRRGVTAGVARELVEKYREERIRRQIDIHDQEVERGTELKNPGGRLRQRIDEDWTPFDGYSPPDERKRRLEYQESQEAERRAQRESEARQRADWEALSPEEKAQRSTDRWIGVMRALKKREPTPDEVAAKHAENLKTYQAQQG
jgi:hypothetical protein